MGYYMRYITTDSQPITLSMLEVGLQAADMSYRIIDTQIENTGDLFHGDVVCGQMEINLPGDGIFEDDIAELKLLVGTGDSPAEARVRRTLDEAKAIIAVEAIWQETDSETVLEQIDPLWDWLFDRYDGLLQADNAGFYDRDQLILEMNLKL